MLKNRLDEEYWKDGTDGKGELARGVGGENWWRELVERVGGESELMWYVICVS